MENQNLTNEEKEVYDAFLESGNMVDMFDLGFAIGQMHMAKKSLESTNL